jgi:hypothetical protein
LVCGVLKESDGEKKSPRKKATIFLEAFEMDSFWKFLLMTSSRRLRVKLLGSLGYRTGTSTDQKILLIL